MTRHACPARSSRRSISRSTSGPYQAGGSRSVATAHKPKGTDHGQDQIDEAVQGTGRRRVRDDADARRGEGGVVRAWVAGTSGTSETSGKAEAAATGRGPPCVGGAVSLRGGCRLPTWEVRAPYMEGLTSLHGGFGIPTWENDFPFAGARGEGIVVG